MEMTRYTSLSDAQSLSNALKLVFISEFILFILIRQNELYIYYNPSAELEKYLKIDDIYISPG